MIDDKKPNCAREGSTHHNACECREAYIRKLEAVARAAEQVQAVCVGILAYGTQNTPRDSALRKLGSALAALNLSKEEKRG